MRLIMALTWGTWKQSLRLKRTRIVAVFSVGPSPRSDFQYAQ